MQSSWLSKVVNVVEDSLLLKLHAPEVYLKVLRSTLTHKQHSTTDQVCFYLALATMQNITRVDLCDLWPAAHAHPKHNANKLSFRERLKSFELRHHSLMPCYLSRVWEPLSMVVYNTLYFTQTSYVQVVWMHVAVSKVWECLHGWVTLSLLSDSVSSLAKIIPWSADIFHEIFMKYFMKIHETFFFHLKKSVKCS
jgi:hypothetical protein